MGNKNSTNNDLLLLNEKQIQLIIHKTGLAKDQVIRLHEEFLKDQPDGFITPTEFETIFKKFYPYGNPKKYAKIAFKAFDADKSGKISFSEFLIATSFVNSSDVAKTIDFAFDVYDSDNNGKVDKKEMLDMVTAIYEIENIDLAAAKNTVEEVFKEYDKDNSNSLNKQEFIKFFLSDPIIQRTFY